eukprot:5519612-Lingulodinium_polyedra.AAC.1
MSTVLRCLIAYFVLQLRRSTSGTTLRREGQHGAQAPRTADPADQGVTHFVHGPVSLDDLVRAAQLGPVDVPASVTPIKRL